jgi:hypothetical protein
MTKKQSVNHQEITTSKDSDMTNEKTSFNEARDAYLSARADLVEYVGSLERATAQAAAVRQEANDLKEQWRAAVVAAGGVADESSLEQRRAANDKAALATELESLRLAADQTLFDRRLDVSRLRDRYCHAARRAAEQHIEEEFAAALNALLASPVGQRFVRAIPGRLAKARIETMERFGIARANANPYSDNPSTFLDLELPPQVKNAALLHDHRIIVSALLRAATVDDDLTQYKPTPRISAEGNDNDYSIAMRNYLNTQAQKCQTRVQLAA